MYFFFTSHQSTTILYSTEGLESKWTRPTRLYWKWKRHGNLQSARLVSQWGGVSLKKWMGYITETTPFQASKINSTYWDYDRNSPGHPRQEIQSKMNFWNTAYYCSLSKTTLNQTTRTTNKLYSLRSQSTDRISCTLKKPNSLISYP